MGAWIEILYSLLSEASTLSRTPRWVRGLKLQMIYWIQQKHASHPTMGAWIEISCGGNTAKAAEVAPHDGCVD